MKTESGKRISSAYKTNMYVVFFLHCFHLCLITWKALGLNFCTNVDVCLADFIPGWEVSLAMLLIYCHCDECVIRLAIDHGLWIDQNYTCTCWRLSTTILLRIFTLPVGAVWSIVMSTSVCLWGYLWNHACDLYQTFCACCLWPWLNISPASLQYVMYLRFCGWRQFFLLQWAI